MADVGADRGQARGHHARLIAEVKRRFAAGEPVGLISELVEDKPWDIREFSIRDFDNNQLRFGRPSSGGAPEGNALEENG